MYQPMRHQSIYEYIHSLKTPFLQADFGSPGMGLINSTHVELLGVASFTGDEDCMDVPGVFSDTYGK